MSYGPDPRDEIFERRRLMAGIVDVERRFGMRRSDRMEVATVLLDRNVETFADLAVPDLDRMWFAFHGAAYVSVILLERKRGLRV